MIDVRQKFFLNLLEIQESIFMGDIDYQLI